MTKPKAKLPKVATAGRAVKCSKCYTDMVEQGNLAGGWDLLCLKCGKRHTGLNRPLEIDTGSKATSPQGLNDSYGPESEE